MRRPIIILFSVIVLLGLFIVLCTFIKHPYEKVLLNRFGDLVTEDRQVRIAYNWYFKLPTDDPIRIDTRLHLYTSPLQQINTAGSQSISVRTYAAWRITDPVLFQRSIGTDARLQVYLGNALSSAVGQTVSSHSIDDLFNVDPAQLKTRKLEDAIREEATQGNKEKKLQGMKELGVEIVQVGFSRMAFSPNNANAIYLRMATEQSTKATKFREEGRAEASRIISEGNKVAAETTANAHREAEGIRGKADAESAAALAAVQQTAEARNFYQYWKTLEFAKSAFSRNTYLVLPTDSDLLKWLFSAPRNMQFQSSAAPPANKPAAPAER